MSSMTVVSCCVSSKMKPPSPLCELGIIAKAKTSQHVQEMSRDGLAWSVHDEQICRSNGSLYVGYRQPMKLITMPESMC